jgi:hypothetical protein
MPYIRCDKDCKPATGQLSEAGVPIKQPASAIVEQEVSCIEYEIYNGDYVRSNLFGGEPLIPDPITGQNEAGKEQKQPDILKGWNADYVKLDVDNNLATQTLIDINGNEVVVSKLDASKHMVTQNKEELIQWYIKHDVDNNKVDLRCKPGVYEGYERVDYFGCYPAPKDPGAPAVDDPTCSALGKPGAPISFTMDGEEVLLALQDDRDNIFVTENQIFHIRLEDNSFITGLVSDSLEDTPEIDWFVDETGNRYIETNGRYTRIE